jgi:hypothetical protein
MLRLAMRQRGKYIFDTTGSKVNLKNVSEDEMMVARLRISLYEDHIHPDYSRQNTEINIVLQKYGIDSTTLFAVANYNLPNKKKNL